MQLLHEHLARERYASALAEAERVARHHRLVRALRAQRRAERTALRARQLLAVATVP